MFGRVDAFRTFSIISELVRENETEELKNQGVHKHVMAHIKKNLSLEGEDETDEWTGNTTNIDGENYKVIENFVTPDLENLSQFGIAPAG